jgi:lactate dehydrogenase-like 2-hydroxyacid dehydrogenase
MPDVLVMGALPGLPATDDRLTLHRFWEEQDQAAFLTKAGGQIRAIATSSATSIDTDLLARLPCVELIACYGVGYDKVDLAAACRRGIIVTNAGDALTEEVADLAVGLLTATVRRLPQADRFVRAGRWSADSFPLSSSLRERIVGIVGLGRIGHAVARRLNAAHVPLAYHDRRLSAEAGYRGYASLLDLATAVDTLVLTAPETDETRHMVNAQVLAALGPRGVVVNVARGGLIDEAALCEALAHGTIWGAGLDVTAHEPHVADALLQHDNVIVLPHIGSASLETRENMGRRVLDNLASWFDGQGPLTPIRETPWPPIGGQ